jgi:hypothetical protein
MSSLRTRAVLALTGLYSAAALFITVATFASTPLSHVTAHQPQSVDRLHKGDLLTRSRASKEAASLISVVLSARSDVVIRDRAGNILFAVDNAAQATTIAKQSRPNAPILQPNPPAEVVFPAGCEGAFSPYAEPAKARIIGRCMSSIVPQAKAA